MNLGDSLRTAIQQVKNAVADRRLQNEWRNIPPSKLQNAFGCHWSSTRNRHSRAFLLAGIRSGAIIPSFGEGRRREPWPRRMDLSMDLFYSVLSIGVVCRSHFL